MFRNARAAAPPTPGWWNNRWFLGLMVLASAVPLLWPTVPPLTDLMGHMGRYRIQLADPASPLRTTYFHFEWGFIANLGIDLLIVPMAKVFGLELGVKLIIIAVPVLTVFGMLWIAHEAHGRVPPTVLFALPLAYSFPFLWGFANFLLSMALALNAYALWLRLGRKEQWKLRHIVFVPIGMLLTVCHVFGWAVLGLLAFGAEVVRARDEGHGFARSFWVGGWSCLSLAPPLLMLLLWRSGDAGGENADFFYWRAKYAYIMSILRNHWQALDLFNVYLLWVLVALGLGGVWVRMNRTLGIAAVMLIIAFILLPRILLGSAYADMRLAPFMFMIAVVALAPVSNSARQAAIIAALAGGLYVWRLAILTGDFYDRDAHVQEQLVALDYIKPNSRVFVEVSLQCIGRWETSRLDHLGAMAIVRKDAFVNGQWTAAGAQLLTIAYAPAKGYAEDPTQVLRPRRCHSAHAKVYPGALNSLPRNAFDYVWLIDMPKASWNSFPGLVPIWTGERRGILYKVLPFAPGEKPWEPEPETSATKAIDTPAGSQPRAAK